MLQWRGVKLGLPLHVLLAQHCCRAMTGHCMLHQPLVGSMSWHTGSSFLHGSVLQHMDAVDVSRSRGISD